jgi:hypothetical protein
MPSISLLSYCFLLGLLPLAMAEVASPPPPIIFQGKAAQAEIGNFMTTRWHRQAWRIEFKPIAGLPGGRPVWHVAGTSAWVRLDGPTDLKEHCDLGKLDPASVYQFEGIPVDQNYGTITFYLLSLPTKVPIEALEKTAQDSAVEAVNVAHPEDQKLTAADVVCLAEACRITALINDGKWEEVETAFATKEGMVALLKQKATLKDWPGIGAYRGFRIDRETPRDVTFRFGFAPKSSPHEIWISFAEGNPSKLRLTVLGW